MKYAYEDLSSKQFEVLIVFLCQELLGMSARGFSDGPDGGRDAKFIGTAQLIPSKSSPWSGTVIIQAKHTNGLNRSFSESDFYSNGSLDNIIDKEIPKIKKLVENKHLNHYMLFANRRLSATAESTICKYLSKKCNLPETSILLCGTEQLELWLKKFPDVPQLANLDPVDSPLIVSPDELSEVIEALVNQKPAFSAVPAHPPTPRTPYDEKNKLNNMDPDYAAKFRKRYLRETSEIQHFLSLPENIQLRKMYESVVDEFSLKIISHRNDHPSFDKIINYLFDLLFKRDPVLRANKRLTRLMLFYMYWNCDIGKDKNAETN